jgi:hypothetical protein
VGADQTLRPFRIAGGEGGDDLLVLDDRRLDPPRRVGTATAATV